MKNKNEETMACKVIKKMDERTLYLTSQQVVCIARGEGGGIYFDIKHTALGKDQLLRNTSTTNI